MLALARSGFALHKLPNALLGGHLAAGTGLAVVLLIAPLGRWQRAALPRVTPAIALTGFAKITIEWHRPSDALRSVLLGVAVSVTGAPHALS